MRISTTGNAQHSGCPDPHIARVGGADTAPVLLHRVDPITHWPVRGVVIVEAIIDRQGVVCSAVVLRSVRPDLDAAALAAVRQWRFVPAQLRGQPVQTAFNITIRFDGK
ncbi:MAG: TonB family protein [Thermoanaerobaculia bacterium]